MKKRDDIASLAAERRALARLEAVGEALSELLLGSGQSTLCLAKKRGFTCMLDIGHRGKHVAHGADNQVLFSWARTVGEVFVMDVRLDAHYEEKGVKTMKDRTNVKPEFKARLERIDELGDLVLSPSATNTESIAHMEEAMVIMRGLLDEGYLPPSLASLISKKEPKKEKKRLLIPIPAALLHELGLFEQAIVLLGGKVIEGSYTTDGVFADPPNGDEPKFITFFSDCLQLTVAQAIELGFELGNLAYCPNCNKLLADCRRGIVVEEQAT